MQVNANPFPFLSFPSQRGTLSGTRSGRKTVDSTLQAPSAPLPAPAAAGSESNAVQRHTVAVAAGHGRSAKKSRSLGGAKPANRDRCNRTALGSGSTPNPTRRRKPRGAARRGVSSPCSPSSQPCAPRKPPPPAPRRLSPNPIGGAKFSEKSRGAPDPGAPYIARHMRSASPVAAGLSPPRARTHLPPL